MSAVDISRFTPAKLAKDVWILFKGGAKSFAQIIFGLLCFSTLCLMRPRNAPKDTEEEQVASPDEASDLESQVGREPGISAPEARSSEGRKVDERPSHESGDERLLIVEGNQVDERASHGSGDERPLVVKRSQVDDFPDASWPGERGGDASFEGSNKKADQASALAEGTPGSSYAIKVARKTQLRTDHEIREGCAKNDPDEATTCALPARQQLAFTSPIRSSTEATPKEFDKDVDPVNADDKAERRDRNVPNNEYRKQNNVTTGLGDDIHWSQATRPITFESETARRAFMNRADAYTEKKIIDSTTSLNFCINTLTRTLIDKVTGNGYEAKALDSRVERMGEDEQQLIQLVKKGLGPRLYAELVETGQPSSTFDAFTTIHDSLDAWVVFCIDLAMKCTLFGVRLRSVQEVNEVFRQMESREPELAQHWKQMRFRDPPRIIDQSIQSLVCNISSSQEHRSSDMEEYAVLEQIYQRDLLEVEQGRQVAMHWRALLHKHELGLASHSEAVRRTELILTNGVLQIFTIAGLATPEIGGFHDKIEKIVKEAAALSEFVKTGIFSQTVETVVVEPGTLFDQSSMKPADEADTDEVKCTLQLGLRATDPSGQGRCLLIPEVLLV